MTRFRATMLLVALGTTIALEAVDIRIQRDPKFDFTRLANWTWNPSGPGEVKVWVSADSKSEPVQRTYEPVIMQAIEEQLGRRGYIRTTGVPPDFTVTYYVLVTTGSSSQYMGQFLPTNAQWGIPLFSPQTTSLDIYPQGTLVLDLALPTGSNLVWRGIAEAKIEIENSEAKRAERLRDIIKDVVAKLPKKER